MDINERGLSAMPLKKSEYKNGKKRAYFGNDLAKNRPSFFIGRNFIFGKVNNIEVTNKFFEVDSFQKT